MPLRTAPQKKAFSLVELSIVLVILGLLVGGILAGQSLIRAAELRAVTSEQGRYTTAISAFRDKYFSIPGDFAKSSSFGWGSYDGDGDGIVEMSTASAGANEISTFWTHLASAGLIEGSYTPASGATLTAGTNNPRSKLSGSNWNVYALGSTGLGVLGTVAASSSTYFPVAYGNAFFFGGGTAAGVPTGVIKAEEAWNLDTKIDDGRPDLGTVTSLKSQSEAVASGGSVCNNPAPTSSASTVYSYDLDSTGATACSLAFKTGY